MAKLIKQPHGGVIRRQEKGDPPINPRGRPKENKHFSELIDELKKEGYECKASSQIQEWLELLLDVDEQRLQEVLTDERYPKSIRIWIEKFLSENGFDALKEVLDRAHGKSVQGIKAEGDLNLNITLVNYADKPDADST